MAKNSNDKKKNKKMCVHSAKVVQMEGYLHLWESGGVS